MKKFLKILFLLVAMMATTSSSFPQTGIFINLFTQTTVYTVTGGGSYCAGGNGVPVGLSGSVVGIQYHLQYQGTITGTMIPGTGASLSAGNQTLPGIYTFTSYDPATGCWLPMTGSAIVIVNALPSITFTMNGPTTFCQGGSVTITGNVSGGIPPYTYQWYRNNSVIPGATSASYIAGALGTGTYKIVVLGGTCTNDTDAYVQVNPLPTVFNVSTVNTHFCEGSNGGIIDLSGSEVGIQYQVMDGAIPVSTLIGTGAALNFNDINNENPLTIIATNLITGCTRTMNGTIHFIEDPLPTGGTISGPSTSCIGESVSYTAMNFANVTNGYDWTLPNGVTNVSGQGTATIHFTYATTLGSVNIKVHGNSCGSGQDVTLPVTVYPIPNANILPPSQTICQGTTAYMTAVNGVHYLWNTGDTTANLAVTPTVGSHTYTVTITGAGGCTATASSVITVNPKPTVTVSPQNPVNCSVNLPILTANGSNDVTQYSWNTGATISQITANTTGTYIVIVSNAYTCKDTAQTSVTINQSPSVMASAMPNVICAGSATILNATGADTYTWQPSNLSGATISISPITTTTYTVTGQSLNGCTGMTTVTVTVNPKPTVTVTPQNPVNCSVNLPILTANGSNDVTQYHWNTGATTAQITAYTTGLYTVIVNNSYNCTDTAQTSVTINQSPTVSASATPNTICAGTSTTLNANGANSYSWQPGNLSGVNVSVSPITTTTYTVTGQSNNGCTGTTSVTVTVNPKPTFTSIGPLLPVCEGDDVSLFVTTNPANCAYHWTKPGFSSYFQNPPLFNVTSTDGGTYQVVATTQYGCKDSVTMNLTVNPTPIINVSANPTAMCAGNTLYLNAAHTGTTISWHGPNGFTSSLQSPIINATTTAATGWYVATTHLNSCSAKDSVYVTVYATPNVSVSASQNNICSGEGVMLTASGNATIYHWQPGNLSGTSVVVYPQVTTTYTVTGTNIAGCTSSATITVTIGGNTIVSQFTSAGMVSCPGGNDGWANISPMNGNYPYSYSWSDTHGHTPQTGQGSSAATGLDADVWTVTITDAVGCHGTNTVTITQPDPIVIVPIINGQTVTVLVSGGTLLLGDHYQYFWQPTPVNGQNTETATFAEGVQYVSLTVTDGHDCQQAMMIDLATAGVVDGDISVTQTFSIYPNPVSDVLHIEIGDQKITEVVIYDITGKIMYIKKGTERVINLTTFSTGLYIVKVTTEDGSIFRTKVVKE